ncbi:hypothetical protein OIU77_014383 [Salix suchowensis]|uniref:acid phosphatase n=1 Tax=Salix suchowensis TaxID=1278906 RepID=A0ABQ8ZX85_9ROSI|nr:hypothetical protein OIU77_014383 [Salix suchowensis]
MGKIGEKLDIDFVVSTGDNFYDNGLTGLNDQAFEESFTKNLHSYEPAKNSVLGNHDYRGDVAAQVHPALRKVDSRWLCLRSFILNTEIAGLFFVDTTPFVIDYFTDMDHTYDWRGVTPRKAYLDSLIKDLESALSESTARWKIVVGHHAIKSAGYHGDTKELNDLLLPMLKAYNVDMYVNGHDHCLEHISSLDSPIQYLTSGAGSKAWRGDLNQNYKEDDLKFFYDGQGFMAVQLTNNDAEITFYNAFGKIFTRMEGIEGASLSSIKSLAYCVKYPGNWRQSVNMRPCLQYYLFLILVSYDLSMWSDRDVSKLFTGKKVFDVHES